MTKKKYRRYSPEFKRHVLKRASEDGVTDQGVCEELGISSQSVQIIANFELCARATFGVQTDNVVADAPEYIPVDDIQQRADMPDNGLEASPLIRQLEQSIPRICIRDLIDIAGIHQYVQAWQINFDFIQLKAFFQRQLKGGCIRLGQWCAIQYFERDLGPRDTVIKIHYEAVGLSNHHGSVVDDSQKLHFDVLLLFSPVIPAIHLQSDEYADDDNHDFQHDRKPVLLAQCASQSSNNHMVLPLNLRG